MTDDRGLLRAAILAFGLALGGFLAGNGFARASGSAAFLVGMSNRR